MFMDKDRILRNNLKSVRKSKKITQGDLANRSGVSRTTIGAIERGEFFPTAKLALTLCEVLNCKFEDLFYFE